MATIINFWDLDLGFEEDENGDMRIVLLSNKIKKENNNVTTK